ALCRVCDDTFLHSCLFSGQINSVQITLSSMIDADWTIGRERADVAGKILADALLNREQGCRPVTLVGTSLGARLIFACLEEIARRHELWEEQVR
ncbi:unnamed protein product, partial [Scytosiphon promiscuus]